MEPCTSEEITIRLLQNGRYTWTITARNNVQSGALQDTGSAGSSERIASLIQRIQAMDRELRDKFPNHVKENSVKFSEFSDE